MQAKRSIQRILTTQVKLRQLVLLKAVADNGTISRAAEMLHMSQPAVSKTIRELEELLGETLFERKATGVVATPFGEQLIRYARSVHAELSRAAEDLTALRDGAGGTLTIGSYMVALPTLLPRALSFFFDKDTTTRVSVVDGSKEKLLDGLTAGKIDIVVGRMSEMGQPESVRQTPLYFEPIVLVAGSKNPLASKPDLLPADLGGQEWIMPPTTSVVRTPISLFFVREEIAAPKRIIETVSYSLIRALLIERNSVAALPWQVVQADIHQGLLVQLPLEIGYPALPVGIITCESHHLSSAATHMIECLHQAASELYHTPVSPR
ncbi:MAG TPA: LysR substrate-binding domain-containing protein [Eoetvoesiella sp.]